MNNISVSFYSCIKFTNLKSMQRLKIFYVGFDNFEKLLAGAHLVVSHDTLTS